MEKSGVGPYVPQGEAVVPEQPSPQGMSHLAMQLGRELWPVVLLGTQLLPDGWRHMASTRQVMEGTRLEGRTAARAGTAVLTGAPWEGHGA